MFPVRSQLAIGRRIGRLAWRFSHYRRHIVRTNLDFCFPEKSEAERLELERESFESFGMGLTELGMAWWTPHHRLQHLARIEGMEHLEVAQARGKGVLLVAAHMTCLEICAYLLQQRVETGFSFREQKNPLLDLAVRRSRERRAGALAPRNDPRSMVRLLKQNHILWFAPDQDYGVRHSRFVPFFDISAATITSLSRIAAMSGAAVVPFQNTRLPDGQGYRLRFEPALEGFPGADLEQDARRINALLEGWIRQDPAQYLWTHRRFKTRPPGQLKFYRAKRRGPRRLPGEAEF